MGPHEIFVAYHLFYLVRFNASVEFDGTGSGTLAGVADAGRAVIMVAGCATGPVRASLRAHPAWLGAPSADDGWEVVEEVSIEIFEPLFWLSPDPGMDSPDEAAFTPTAPGVHRVRVSGRGRSNAYDLAILEPVEDYLVDIWPEPSWRAAEVLRTDRTDPV